MSENLGEYRLRMRGVKKSFSGVKALKGVDFSLRKGEIHALVGENGAGKSTLMKVLSGAYDCDEGEIYIDGARVKIGTPRRGKELGVGIVYQDFELAEDITIAENIFIDNLGSRGIVRWGKLFADARRKTSDLGFEMDVRVPVREISVAYKQVVEIAKALSTNARILVLDEPTAVLTPRETDKLFATMRFLKESGVSVVYISHRMDEIFTVADSITIMRDGEVTGGGTISDFTVDRVVELMIGRKLDTMYPARSSAIGAEALRVENLTCGAFKNISFTLRKGEILGLFGLVGSGRSELAHAIFGEIRPTGGTIYVEGSEVGIHSPYQGRKHGIALIPEDRKEQGLVLDMPIRQNMTMTDMKKVCGPLGVILPSRERDVSDSLIKRLSVKTGDAENRTDSLSGGNQQKVVFAKWLNTDSEIMIMDEPTRGVDVGAKVEIYGIMNALAARGTAILMISSELNEIIGMCDRTLVIDNGEIKGELSRDEMSESKAMKLVVGGV